MAVAPFGERPCGAIAAGSTRSSFTRRYGVSIGPASAGLSALPTAARRPQTVSQLGSARMAGLEKSEYLTPGEAAEVLHVSPKTISRWANRGLLPYLVTLGGHRRFRREDIEAVARRMAGET